MKQRLLTGFQIPNPKSEMAFPRYFYRNLFQLIEAIEECYNKGRRLPCLVLLYSGVDVIASLERSGEETTGREFIHWVEAYLIPAGSLPCTGVDLYGARCGILHTFIADSRLSRKGEARPIVYGWGDANAADLQVLHSRLGLQNELVSIHVRDLINAFRNGIDNYLKELDNDPERQKVVATRVGGWFIEMGTDIVRSILDLDW